MPMKYISKETKSAIRGIFSSAAFCTYSWALIIFFWDIPSLLLRYNTTDILGYAAYQFMFALFESALVTIFVMLLGFVLPAKFIRSTFQTSGTALVLAFAINAIFFKKLSNIANWITAAFSLRSLTAIQVTLGLWAFSIVVLPIILIAVSKREKVREIIGRFIENLSILVGLYIFLSVIGTLAVIIRNIF